MTDVAKLRTRPATVADAAAIAEIYNQGHGITEISSSGENCRSAVFGSS
jgi:hypothetical protein